MVVVAAILAVILVLSTSFLVVRTKISKVKEEQRVLARALQNYQMDYSNMPTEQRGLDALTAPTAYLASIPADPFSRDQVTRTYLYFTPDGIGRSYAIVSAGPDGRFDVLPYLNQARIASGRSALSAQSGGGSAAAALPPEAAPIDTSSPNWFEDFLVEYTYDPTNGTYSSGDIVTRVVNY